MLMFLCRPGSSKRSTLTTSSPKSESINFEKPESELQDVENPETELEPEMEIFSKSLNLQKLGLALESQSLNLQKLEIVKSESLYLFNMCHYTIQTLCTYWNPRS